MKSILFLMLYLSMAGQAWAISESDFDTGYDQKVEPFYNLGHTDFIKGVHGVEHIGYGVFPANPEKAAVIIVPGRSEPLIKYREVIYDLGSKGYSIYILDHRGQGYSDRMVPDHEMGYVDDFGNYVLDLKNFIDQVVVKSPHKKIFMLAHSMGGAIAALYLLDYPNVVDAAVLSAPMLEINFGTHSMEEVLGLLSWNYIRGNMGQYAEGQGPYNWLATFEGNTTIGSRARFDASMDLVLREQTTAIGGLSYQWLKESMIADEKIKLIAGEISTPILMLQAGQDSLVKPEGENEFVQKCQHCELIKFPKAHHEILQEVDSIRDLALNDIVQFFDRQK